MADDLRTRQVENLRFCASKKDGDPNVSRIASSNLIWAADEIDKLAAALDERDELLRELRDIVAAMPISEMVGRIVGQDKVRTYEEARGMFVRSLAKIDLLTNPTPAKE